MAHVGSLVQSTLSIVARLPGGVTFATLFNHFPNMDMAIEVQECMIAAIGAVGTWPEKDLYSLADR